ncbi:hypothetical protein [Simkania sp.]|uniref:hypothetical protein n=1 Tax=Simkania sp. TaxID=34094 RepID=UPI003B51A352
MEQGTTLSRELIILGIQLSKAIVLSAIFGFFFPRGLRELIQAWKKNQRVKVWLYMSGCAFLTYAYFFGFK